MAMIVTIPACKVVADNRHTFVRKFWKVHTKQMKAMIVAIPAYGKVVANDIVKAISELYRPK